MRLFVLFLLSMIPVWGQAVLNGDMGSALPGDDITVSVSLAAQGAQITGVQFAFAAPSTGTVGPFAGAASAVPGKSMTCLEAAGLVNCLLVGFNSDVLPDGKVANLSFPTTAGFDTGFTLALQNVVATDAAGSAVAIAPGTELTFSPRESCPDPNRDGTTDVLDVQLTVNAAIGGSCVSIAP